MLTIEELKKVDPGLKDFSDEHLTKVRDALYELAGFCFDVWLEERNKALRKPEDMVREGVG